MGVLVMKKNEIPKTGGNSPWGEIDYVDEILEGHVYLVFTGGHGGAWVSEEKLETAYVKNSDTGEKIKLGDLTVFCGERGWFEEDCDWCMVAIALPQLFKREFIKMAEEETRVLSYIPNLEPCDKELCLETSSQK